MKDRIKVLFIGNSHTYYNDMAYMLKYLTNEYNKTCSMETVMLAHPWKTLGEHKNEPEVRFNILYGDYDYVVLQQAAHPFPGEDVLIGDALDINKYIKASAAVPIVYMTWAEKSHPENQEVMTSAYLKLADRIGALVAPVGIAFQKLLNCNPQVELFDDDGGHASPLGSYLIACVFYSVIFRKSPFGLPSRIMYGDRCLYDFPEQTAELFQKTAWEAVEGYI